MFIKINEFVENKERSLYHSIIDYTKITDAHNNDKLKDICKEAEDNNFHSVCVFPESVATCKSFLTHTKVVALVDFPDGKSNTSSKKSTISDCIINGADEIDVVINYKLIKDTNKHDDLSDEIRELSEFCHKEGSTIKAIIEIGALNYQEIENICNMCVDGNVDYVMTSTGKFPKDDSFDTKLTKIKFMNKILPSETKIKFSGGLRTVEQMKELKQYVDRIGTSTIPK